MFVRFRSNWNLDCAEEERETGVFGEKTSWSKQENNQQTCKHKCKLFSYLVYLSYPFAMLNICNRLAYRHFFCGQNLKCRVLSCFACIYSSFNQILKRTELRCFKATLLFYVDFMVHNYRLSLLHIYLF